MRQLPRLLALLLITGLLAACGAAPAAQAPTSGPAAPAPTDAPAVPAATTAPSAERSVTIENCGEQVTYTKIPERAVSNDVNITEIMLALGLQDRMVGMGGIGDTGKLLPEYQALAANVPILSENYITLEPLLGANPDFVFAGWFYGFSDESGITPNSLNEKGIATYVLEESCVREGARPPATLENTLFHDIRNLGIIFDVEERAEALIAQYERELAEVQAALPADADLTVFLYDSGEQEVLTAGANAIPTDLIARAGGTNVFNDIQDSWTSVGWEAIVERNPEFIVIVDYGEVTAEQKQAFATNLPAMKDVPAVVNQRFAVLPYAAATPGPRNIAAVRTLAEAFYPDAFGATPAAPAAGGFPVTIENCGVTQTFAAPPERVMSMTQNATEMLLALGLQDRIVGAATLEVPLPPDYAKAFANVPVLTNTPGLYPSQEVVIGTNPDFLISNVPSAFSAENFGLLSREELQAQEIGSYLFSPNCPDRSVPPTIELVYTDILNLGRIFGVESRAQAVVAQMQREIADVQAKLAAIDPATKPQVFVFDSDVQAPWTIGNAGIAHHIITTAGGEPIFADQDQAWVQVSWEEVIRRDPQVIIPIQSGSGEGGADTEKIQLLLGLPQLASVTAIAEQRFVGDANFMNVFEAGVRNAEGIRMLAEVFYPEAFK